MQVWRFWEVDRMQRRWMQGWEDTAASFQAWTCQTLCLLHRILKGGSCLHFNQEILVSSLFVLRMVRTAASGWRQLNHQGLFACLGLAFALVGMLLTGTSCTEFSIKCSSNSYSQSKTEMRCPSLNNPEIFKVPHFFAKLQPQQYHQKVEEVEFTRYCQPQGIETSFPGEHPSLCCIHWSGGVSSCVKPFLKHLKSFQEKQNQWRCAQELQLIYEPWTQVHGSGLEASCLQ